MKMSPYLKSGAAVGALLLSVISAQAQEKLTLERVFASPDLSGPQPRALKLSPDGKLVTLLKPRTDEKERLDLWARSEEHTSELQSLMRTSYAVFCLQKKNQNTAVQPTHDKSTEQQGLDPTPTTT